jgi:hypothetical protein
VYDANPGLDGADQKPPSNGAEATSQARTTRSKAETTPSQAGSTTSQAGSTTSQGETSRSAEANETKPAEKSAAWSPSVASFGRSVSELANGAQAAMHTLSQKMDEYTKPADDAGAAAQALHGVSNRAGRLLEGLAKTFTQPVDLVGKVAKDIGQTGGEKTLAVGKAIASDPGGAVKGIVHDWEDKFAKDGWMASGEAIGTIATSLTGVGTAAKGAMALKAASTGLKGAAEVEATLSTASTALETAAKTAQVTAEAATETMGTGTGTAATGVAGASNALATGTAGATGAAGATANAAAKAGVAAAEDAAAGVNAAGSMVSKLENLSAQSQAEGIKAIHNAWLDQSKASLGMKTKDTPDARPFAMQVDVNAKGQLVLGKGGKLTDAERQFIEKVGEQPGNTAAENFEAGRAGLIDKITQNNKGALQESLALVAQHIEGSGAPPLSGYAEQAAALAKPALPETSARVTADAVKGSSRSSAPCRSSSSLKARRSCRETRFQRTCGVPTISSRRNTTSGHGSRPVGARRLAPTWFPALSFPQTGSCSTVRR